MRIETLFTRSSRQLSEIRDTICRLQKLNTCVAGQLEKSFSRHYQVASYTHGKLVLVTHSTAWATRMRYLMPDLIKKLRKDSVFAELKAIICLIDPGIHQFFESSPPLPEEKPPRLTESTRALLRRVSNSISSPELRASLLRLAKS